MRAAYSGLVHIATNAWHAIKAFATVHVCPWLQGCAPLTQCWTCSVARGPLHWRWHRSAPQCTASRCTPQNDTLSYQLDTRTCLLPDALWLMRPGCDAVLQPGSRPPEQKHGRIVTRLPPQVSGAAVADAQANAARISICNAMFQQADLDRGMPAAAAAVTAISAPDVVITGSCCPHPAAGTW